MQSMPPCPSPAHWWWMRASGLLLHWQLRLGVYSVGLFFFFFPSQLCCPLRFQNSPQTRVWEDFIRFGNFSSFTTPSPGRVSIPNSFISLFVFYILSYLLSNGLPFWVPGVLCQHSEVVLWKLLSIQMVFWSNCWGESGLPILFLCHLRTAPTRGSLVPLHFLP